jgi:hypothetical protein
MPILKFRCTIEDYEDVYRDIEIKHTQTVQQLTDTLLKAYQFDNHKDKTLFISDDLWRKKSNLPQDQFDKKKIGTLIDDPKKKFIFYYDTSDGNFEFLIELFKIQPDKEGDFPAITANVGIGPVQYKNIPRFIESDMPDESILAAIANASTRMPDNEEPDDSTFYANDHDPILYIESESDNEAAKRKQASFEEDDLGLDEEDEESDDLYGDGEEDYGLGSYGNDYDD